MRFPWLSSRFFSRPLHLHIYGIDHSNAWMAAEWVEKFSIPLAVFPPNCISAGAIPSSLWGFTLKQTHFGVTAMIPRLFPGPVQKEEARRVFPLMDADCAFCSGCRVKVTLTMPSCSGGACKLFWKFQTGLQFQKAVDFCSRDSGRGLLQALPFNTLSKLNIRE